MHCVKSVCGPHSSAFVLNTETRKVSIRFSPNAANNGPEQLRIRTLFAQLYINTFICIICICIYKACVLF